MELKAPNGYISNLTAEQYRIVRTTEFRTWFGDWLNEGFHKNIQFINPILLTDKIYFPEFGNDNKFRNRFIKQKSYELLNNNKAFIIKIPLNLNMIE